MNPESNSRAAVFRRTKIVATLGPATDEPGQLDRMIASGLDVARVNFSHGTPQEHQRRVTLVRERAAAHGRHVGVLVDLQGPKIRIEGFRDGPIALEQGDRFVLDPRLGPKQGDATRVGVSLKTLAQDLAAGDVLLLDDGNVVMDVTEVKAPAVHCRVRVGGALSDNKGLNRQGGGLSAQALTEKDINDIRQAAELEADYVAVSFVREASDIDRARELLVAAGGDGLIVAKIERAEAIENVAAIIEASDVVMIARGDLGVEIGDAELPAMQKRIIAQARNQNRVVITATQMMQSMVENAQPTRAEVLDVANAVMDGTDAVMLSAGDAGVDAPYGGGVRIHRGGDRHGGDVYGESHERARAGGADRVGHHGQVDVADQLGDLDLRPLRSCRHPASGDPLPWCVPGPVQRRGRVFPRDRAGDPHPDFTCWRSQQG